VNGGGAAERTLRRRGLRLEYVTLAWNVVGTVVVILAALAARSIALAGFGLDSLIEIFASIVVVWQLTGATADRERKALRLIGIAFALLSLYILAQSVRTLASGHHPGTSIGGLIWLALTVLVMLALAAGKRQTGNALGNLVLQTEARVTLIDAGLAAAVLVGIALNTTLGWWWADPLAGLAIVYYGAREGAHALRG